MNLSISDAVSKVHPLPPEAAGDEAQKQPSLDRLPCDIDLARSKKSLFFHGVKVLFPFAEPLAPQRQVMEGVVRSIVKKQCVLLESPTGTGKTQALLSASLAAQRHLQEESGIFSKIIFATRTIGQVRQLPAELRKNPYKATSGPLASRKHLCTNDTVNKLSNGELSQRCRKMARSAEALRRSSDKEEDEVEEDKVDQGCPLYHGIKTSQHAETVHAAARFRGTGRRVPSFRNNCGTVVDIEDLQGTVNLSDLCDIAGRHSPAAEESAPQPRGCAYYTSRALAKQSHITFCTYNYLMSPGIRSAVGIDEYLSNSIVIIDEAHNVESVARDGGSATISLFELYTLQHFLEYASKKLRNALESKEELVEVLAEKPLLHLIDTLRTKLEEAEEWFEDESSQARISLRDREKFKRPPSDRDVVEKYDWGAAGKRPKMDNFFDAFELDSKQILDAHKEAEAISQAAREADDDSFVYADECLELTTVFVFADKHRAHYAACVRAWYEQGCDYRQSFGPRLKDMDDGQQLSLTVDGDLSDQVVVGSSSSMLSSSPSGGGGGWFARKRGKRGVQPTWGFELNLALLHPGVMMDDLSRRVRALVLASGTLSPVEKTERELGSQFAKRMNSKPLEAKHVVCTQNQLIVRAVTRADVPRHGPVTLECKGPAMNTFKPQGKALCFGIGETVARLVESVPGGVLVFFPSHKTLKSLVDFWQRSSPEYGGQTSASNLWQRFKKAKGTVLIEASDAAKNDEIIASYREAIESRKSALLLCAFRGKCSEGISFNDDACRLVVCIGIPYPPCYDDLVVRKKDYNDDKLKGGEHLGEGASDEKCMSGNTWYTMQAFRALNQALGRCIRHLNDYGAVVLCDSRFEAPGTRSQIAAWLRDAVECADLSHVAGDLRRHFVTAPAFVKREFRERMGLRPRLINQVRDDKKIGSEEAASKTMSKARTPTSHNQASTRATVKRDDEIADEENVSTAKNLLAVYADACESPPLPSAKRGSPRYVSQETVTWSAKKKSRR